MDGLTPSALDHGVMLMAGAAAVTMLQRGCALIPVLHTDLAPP